MDLADLLGREVDIVTEAGLKPRVWERILREAVALGQTAGWVVRGPGADKFE